MEKTKQRLYRKWITVFFFILLISAFSLLTACQKNTETVQADPSGENMIEMSMDELAKFNGKDGAKAYIAVEGVIYDVTDVPAWKGGEHQNKHHAGIDATQIITGAPHGKSVLKKLPVVGKIKE